MKHWCTWLIVAGALAMMGCGGVAPPKPANPLAAAPTAAPAPTPAAEYSCGDGYIFDSDQLPGPEGAVVKDVFYWGSSTSGAARCFSDTRNNSMVGGRVESNADDATAATVLSVTLAGERRWYFILHFSDGTYCSAATPGDGRATCFATVKRDATGFRLDALPAVPLPVPSGAPEPPVEGPGGPGGGDEGGGHTGAPEPEGTPETPGDPGGGDEGGGNTGAPEPEERFFTYSYGAYAVGERNPSKNLDQNKGKNPVLYGPATSEDCIKYRNCVGTAQMFHRYLSGHNEEPGWYIVRDRVEYDSTFTLRRRGGEYDCILATTGNGKMTCATKLDIPDIPRSKPVRNRAPLADDFPTLTAPQSADGKRAFTARMYRVVPESYRGNRGPESVYTPIGAKESRTAAKLTKRYLILVFPDATYCNAATAGDGIVTCVETVKWVDNASGTFEWEFP